MLKNRKITILVSVLIALTALVVLLFGGAMAGWNILAWFKSDDATWLYLLIFLFIFITAWMLVNEWVRK